MGKRVILSLTQGSFEKGFAVSLQIREDGHEENEIKREGKLPPAPNLLELFKQWQSDYRQLVTSFSRLEPLSEQLVNYSYPNLGFELSDYFDKWLNSASKDWQDLRDALQQSLNKDDEILVMIETNNPLVRQLPWHSWDLFSEDFTRSEVSLSVPEYETPRKKAVSFNRKVKVLAILGNTEGLDIKRDKAILNQLPNAEVTFIENPEKRELNDRLWNQQWHIIYFAGHSSSDLDGKTGRIYINQGNSLSLTNFKNGLKTAIGRGLQLAIFNSCDGLGLAWELADLHIPQVIVMREPVPEVVAQEFLQHFLRAFSQGSSSYLAMREARERLQEMEVSFPCASWLPVICQNPSARALKWEQLCGNVSRDLAEVPVQPQKRRMLPTRRLVQAVFLVSAITTALVIGVRYVGLLQSWELQAFDQTLQRRPEEVPDRRFLVVTIDEDDLNLPEQGKRETTLPPEQALAREKSSLSDQGLTILLKKLRAFKAKAIGLDIYRDFKATNQGNLESIMTSNGNLFAICRVSILQHQEHGISPPPEIPAKRLGFSDVVVDGDRVLRRHLLAMKALLGFW